MVRAGNKGTYKHMGVESKKFAILTFAKIFPQAKIIHLEMDSIVALSYIAKMGSTDSLAKAKRIMITVEYLTGTMWYQIISHGQ